MVISLNGLDCCHDYSGYKDDGADYFLLDVFLVKQCYSRKNGDEYLYLEDRYDF